MPRAVKLPDDFSIRALGMRVGGADYDGIALVLGGHYDRKFTAKQVETVILAELRKLEEPEDTTGYLDLARLNAMLRAVWPKAMEGDVKAITESRELMDRKRLLEVKAQPKEPTQLDRVRGQREKRVGGKPAS